MSHLAAAGFPHGSAELGQPYFCKSPWVSSDLLVSLKYGLAPAGRGLVQTSAVPVWTFPPDYIDRLRQALTAMGESHTKREPP